MTALSPKNRLTESEKIGEVARRGRRFDAAGLRAYFRKSADKTWRVSIVVPKKTDKRATARNRLKRRAGEIIRRSMPAFGVPADVVVYLEAGSAKLSFAELKDRLEGLLERAFK